MESNRAKEHIDSLNPYYKRLFRVDLSAQLRHDATKAVLIAEQDAEERAVKAANLLYEELEPMFLHPMAREWVIDKFKAFYNNGGQSDETIY